MSTFFKKTLSFLGLAEEDADDYSSDSYNYRHDDNYIPDDEYEEEGNRRYSFSQKSFPKQETGVRKSWGSSRSPKKLFSIDGARDLKKMRVSVSEPHEFEEVQNIGDDLKVNTPVIVNLQNTNPDLSKRIIDFCSGLTYALEGSIKKVADRVFLITPKDTVVTSNEKEILRERGLYNQL